MDILAAVGLSLLAAACSLVVAEVAKAGRRVRLATGAAFAVAAIVLLGVGLFGRSPAETTIRTYLAFPIAGERFEVGYEFPNVFTEYTVPLPPDTLRVSGTSEGMCTTGSVVVSGRADAWRCTASDPVRTLDPCFQNVFAEGQVLCVNAPWTESGTALDLAEPLPETRSAVREPSTPWAVETDGGALRVRRPGDPVVIGMLSFSYSCTTGNPLSPEGLLSAEINQSGLLWTAFLAEGAERDIQEVGIVVAWF